MDTEEINYEALCNQFMKENEGLRINIIKLKNDEITLIDRIKDKISDIVDDEHFLLYFYISIFIFSMIIVPLVKAFIAYIVRRKGNNNEG